jgi:hypothetical protein
LIEVSHEDLELNETQLGWCLQISSHADTMLVAWAVEKWKDLFEEVFGTQSHID